MTADGFRFHSYEWRGRREWMLLRGPEDGPQVLVLPPLFEELNFTRALLAETTRRLAAQGIGTCLPDLPGTGESAWPLEALGWNDWRGAARCIGESCARRGPLFTCAFRGGALLDDAVGARARWRYAPEAGATLLRQLRRAQSIADQESGTGAGDTAELVGYRLGAAMLTGLEAAVPASGADRVCPAGPAPLWRRAEPGRDDALAERLASDICDWVAACGGR